ncbi:MAG: D-glycero-beta-D-manno-heptose 1-phosphate adenylyltransferase [Mariprofundaceae bacterium]
MVNDRFLPLDSALQRIEAWRYRQEKIVFTNGCFDLLHPGHVTYLEKSRALGDRLIIGINSDASIQQLKGMSRPIHPLADRATMLAALRVVDLVIPFKQDTPIALIEAIIPDVLVKGGDYQRDEIVGADLVQTHGGHVTTIPFIGNYSSTRIIQKLQAS